MDLASVGTIVPQMHSIVTFEPVSFHLCSLNYSQISGSAAYRRSISTQSILDPSTTMTFGTRGARIELECQPLSARPPARVPRVRQNSN